MPWAPLTVVTFFWYTAFQVPPKMSTASHSQRKQSSGPTQGYQPTNQPAYFFGV